MASRRADFFYVWVAAMLAAVISALMWGHWFFTSPITIYETSRKLRITDQESVRMRFPGKQQDGAVRMQSFRKRLILADFPPKALERIKPGQTAYVYVRDRIGERTLAVPATVIADFAPKALERTRPGQTVHVYVKDRTGNRTFSIPVPVIEMARSRNKTEGQVILEAEVPADRPDPFENRVGKKVRIEAGHVTPADLIFRASGLGTDTPPVSSAPRGLNK